MAIQDLKESFWRSIKFLLLFLIMFTLVYIALTKFILKVPVADNQRLLAAITEFETVIDNEKKTAEQLKIIAEEIKVMEFDIYQVQKQDDIKREIFKIQSMYEENNLNSKYKFSIQAKKILDIYFNTRQRNSKLKSNIDLISNNLTQCEANL